VTVLSVPVSSVPARPLIAAHRGASKAEKENTIAAFRVAVAMGADMIELDVRRSADGVMVVHHDASVRVERGSELPGTSGTSGALERKDICNLRRDQLPGDIPNLVDALIACRPLRVNIEIKSDRNEPGYDAAHRLTDQVLELLQDPMFSEGVLISSFDRDVIERVKQRASHIHTGFLYSFAFRPSRVIQVCKERGHVAIHPNHSFLSESVVADAHAAGLAVNAWTVDSPERAERLTSWGVDALITNVPDRLLTLFESTVR
jgi:glycerophosphoryl diester phosphodiesterase